MCVLRGVEGEGSSALTTQSVQRLHYNINIIGFCRYNERLGLDVDM